MKFRVFCDEFFKKTGNKCYLFICMCRCTLRSQRRPFRCCLSAATLWALGMWLRWVDHGASPLCILNHLSVSTALQTQGGVAFCAGMTADWDHRWVAHWRASRPAPCRASRPACWRASWSTCCRASFPVCNQPLLLCHSALSRVSILYKQFVIKI